MALPWTRCLFGNRKPSVLSASPILNLLIIASSESPRFSKYSKTALPSGVSNDCDNNQRLELKPSCLLRHNQEG